MRIRQALALVFLVALCGATAAIPASAKSTAVPVCKLGQKSSVKVACLPTPACKAGQTNTNANPCVPPAAIKEVAPIEIDPGDTGERQGRGDAVTVITFLDIPRGLYQLSVTNTSGLGFINTFDWVAPTNMTITAITSSEGGHCQLVSGNIHCRGGGKGIAPPKCTCEGGAALTVNFTADGLKPTFNGKYYTYYGVEGGWLHILTMTPVPYHIPSFKSTHEDFPICGSKLHPSKLSTLKSPCSIA